MAQAYRIHLVDSTVTLLFTAGSSGNNLVFVEPNSQSGAPMVLLGGPDVDVVGIPLNNGETLSSGFQHNYLPIILGPNETIYGFATGSDGAGTDVGFLATGVQAAQSSTTQHVVIDSGTVTANQGSPNILANAWPVRTK
jgi:hypothetical protein